MKVAIIVIGVALVLSGCGKEQAEAPPRIAKLDSVIDGTTLSVVTSEGSVEQVRLIGVQIPSPEANERAVRWLRGVYDKGYPLLLTFDTLETDRDGSIMAYVFAGKGTENISPEEVARSNAKSQIMHAVIFEGKVYGFVNASLIKGGRAQPAPKAKNRKYASLFWDLHQTSSDVKAE